MTERNSNLDTSHSWSRTETVTHPTNIAYCRLTSVRRQIVCATIPESPMQEGLVYRKKCPFNYWSVVSVIKIWRQKDICMGERPKDMCPFRYWRTKEGNSECTGKFHQSPETKKSDLKKRELFQGSSLKI